MSAWAHIVAKAETPEEVAELNAALLEIQAETARRLASRIRTRLGDREAADLIDPDVP